MKRRARTLACAWVALAAMVFGAISPALAAAVLRDRPAALGQMLGIPESAAADPSESHDEGCEHHAERPAHAAQHGTAHDGAPTDRPTHHAHNLYCSFCLSATATVALPGAAAPAIDAPLGHARGAADPPALALTAPHPYFRSRAPPRGAPVAI